LIDFLDVLGVKDTSRFLAEVCGYSSYRCGDCGVAHVRPLVRGGSRNPYVGLHNAEISAVRFLKAIKEGLKDPYILRIVVTLPKHYSLDEVIEIAKGFVKLLQELYYKGQICARIYVHPSGKDLQYHPHFELWFVNYVLDDDELIRVQPFLNIRVIRALLFKLGIEKPQFWCRYYRLKTQFKKCVDDMTYAGRPFSFDVLMALKSGKEIDEKMAKFLLDYKPRAIPMGWATKYRKVLGLDDEDEKVEVVCPFCGGICRPVYEVAPVMVKTHLVRIRGVIHEVKIEGFS